MKKIAAQAEVLHMAVCPQNPSGPVANAASLIHGVELPIDGGVLGQLVSADCDV